MQEHASAYKAVFAASPTNPALAGSLYRNYDPSELGAAVFLVSSTGDTDEKLFVSLEGLQEIYDLIPDTNTRIMARRKDADHSDMLYRADGYMTAWFMWQLRGDGEAAKPSL